MIIIADGKVVIDIDLNSSDAEKGLDNLNNKFDGAFQDKGGRWRTADGRFMTMKEKAEMLGDSIDDMGQSAERGGISLGKIVTALGLVAVATSAIKMVKDSIQDAFSRIDTMESFERVMNEITGSSETTNRVLDRTGDIVTGTAYGLDVAAQAVQNFVTRGVDVDKATDRIEAWGDAVAFYGDGSNEQFANVSDALAKMTTSGKVGMDQLNRLFDVGIDAVGMYAKATGRNAEEVQKDLSAGKITAEDFIDTVTEAMMNGTNGVLNISGAAKEAGASWGASFDNMQAAVTRGVVNIIQNIDEMLTSNGLPDMRSMVAEFGKAFETALKAIGDNIPTVVAKIKEIYTALQPWLPLIGAITAGVITFIATLATINTVKSIITGIRGAFIALNATMLANPFVLIAAAIVAAAILVYVYWEPISEFFIMLWEKIKIAGLVIWEVLKMAWQATVDWFKELWSTITEFFSNLWSDTGESATSIWDSVMAVWQATVDWFKTTWSTIVEFFTTLWAGIVLIATTIWDAVVAKWQEVVTFVTTLFAPLIEFFMTMWTTISENALQIWDNISTMLSTVWTNIQTMAVAAWDLIKFAILGPILLLIDLVTGDMTGFALHLAQIWEGIKEAANTIWTLLKETVSIIITTLIENAKLAWDTFKTYITGLWTAIWETAKNIFEWIKNSVQEKMEQAKAILTTIWETIKTTFNNAMTAIWQWVKDKFQQMKDSIKQKMDEAKSLLETIWGNIKTFFTETLSEMWTTVKQKFEDIKDAIFDKMTEAKETITDLWNQAQEFLSGIDLYQIGVDIIQGLINGIGSMISAVTKKVGEVVDSVKGALTGGMGIFSPSRWMRDMIGHNMMAGWEIGMERERGSVEKMADAATDWMKPNVPDMSDVIGRIKSLATPVGGLINVGAVGAPVQHIVQQQAARTANQAQQPIVNVEVNGHVDEHGIWYTVESQNAHVNRMNDGFEGK